MYEVSNNFVGTIKNNNNELIILRKYFLIIFTLFQQLETFLTDVNVKNFFKSI